MFGKITKFIARENKLKGKPKPAQEQVDERSDEEIKIDEFKKAFEDKITDIFDHFSEYSQLHKYAVLMLYQFTCNLNDKLEIYDQEHPEECSPNAPEKSDEELEEEAKDWFNIILGEGL